MSSELAPVSQEAQVAILRALNLDPKDPKTQALVMTCQRYGLDPLLKHALLIQGSLYVTRDGLMHVAHASGKFNGIKVDALPETPTHFVARAEVWRKDMEHPFVYQGRYPKAGRGGPGAQYGPEMAEKVAECRALRRAFSIALCSREEAWETEDTMPAPVQQPTPKDRAIAPRPEDVIAAPAPSVIDPARQAAIQSFIDAAGVRGVGISDSREDRRTLLVALLWPGQSAPQRQATLEEWERATTMLIEKGIPAGWDLSDPFAKEDQFA